MLAGNISEEYRCLVEILTCLVCKGMVDQAHICPNCSKFYCYACIIRQLGTQQKCLNCNRFLSVQMLVNCQKLCSDLTETLQKVKLRGLQATRLTQDKSPYYCYRHKLEKTYYCQTCDRPLCSDCSVLTETHRGHEFIKLSIIKASYEQRMREKFEAIATFKQNLEKKLQMYGEGKQSKGLNETDGLEKLQSRMKSLRCQLKKKLKKLLNDSEKQLNDYNDAVQSWNVKYESWIQALKNTSKGKFIQLEYDVIESGLNLVFNEIAAVQKSIDSIRVFSRQKNKVVNYIYPDYHTYAFILEQFSEKGKENHFFYTEHITTKQGLKMRLKIYPKGILKMPQQEEIKTQFPKMIRKQSKNEDYFAVFIELVDGPVANTKQKHQIILVNQNKQDQLFTRQFQSEFDIGQCWGYEHYIKLNQLYEEGYYNRQYDFVQIRLKIGPCSYYQATKDQMAFLNIKKEQLKLKRLQQEHLTKCIDQKAQRSTSSMIELSEQSLAKID